MKKVISIALMLVLCFALACPVFAEESEFVPSIGYKDHPEIIKIELVESDGTVIEVLKGDCLLIVPISKVLSAQQNARSVITDPSRMTNDEKTLFVDVYNKLLDGSMTVPYPDGNNNKVIRDLIFTKFLCEEHAVELAKDDVFIRLTFDVGVKAEEKVDVMVYNDANWVPATSIENNGDGTVTTILDDLGIIAFAVPYGSDTPVTGDNSSSNNLVWVIVMVSSAAALVAVVASRRKITDK